QDNRVEWFFDDATHANLNAYMQAGVVAFLFGRAADGSTCACDAAGDGITNPDPINGNTLTSLSADDDGGYFRWRATQYYAAGAVPLPSPGSTGPPSATATATVAGTARATATSTAPATGGGATFTAVPTGTPGGATLTGDLNRDGKVDVFDMSLFANNFGQTG